MTGMTGAKMDDHYIEFWKQILSTGPTCLVKQDWQAFEHRVKLDDLSRVAFRHLLEGLDNQTRWIVERTKSIREEGERMVHIGQMLKRAGLKSYTDKDGNIFVAADT